MHLKPFESLPRSLPIIPFQKSALWAEMTRGLNNLCADLFCIKSDNIFSGAVVGWVNPECIATRKCGTKWYRLNLGQEARAHQEAALN